MEQIIHSYQFYVNQPFQHSFHSPLVEALSPTVGRVSSAASGPTESLLSIIGESNNVNLRFTRPTNPPEGGARARDKKTLQPLPDLSSQPTNPPLGKAELGGPSDEISRATTYRLHSPVWVQYDGLIPSMRSTGNQEKIIASLIQSNGSIIKMYPSYIRYEDSFGKQKLQYIFTTIGRVILNSVFHTYIEM
jgi:hypothetical protein